MGIPGLNCSLQTKALEVNTTCRENNGAPYPCVKTRITHRCEKAWRQRLAINEPKSRGLRQEGIAASAFCRIRSGNGHVRNRSSPHNSRSGLLLVQRQSEEHTINTKRCHFVLIETTNFHSFNLIIVELQLKPDTTQILEAALDYCNNYTVRT